MQIDLNNLPAQIKRDRRWKKLVRWAWVIVGMLLILKDVEFNGFDLLGWTMLGCVVYGWAKSKGYF